MNRYIYRLLVVVLTVPSICCIAKTHDDLLPFSPKEAIMVSAPGNLMTHAPSVVIDKEGIVYACYFRDREQIVEKANNTTIELVLARFPIRKYTHCDISRTVLMKTGMTYGDYTHGPRAPYDPTLLLLEDRLICTFNGYENGEPLYCRMTIDKQTGTVDDRIERCDITYFTSDGEKKTLPLSRSGVIRIYRDKGFGEPEHVDNCALDKDYVYHDGWYYNTLFAWNCPQTRPIIIRTRDGIHFEEAFTCNEYPYGCVECGIAVKDGEFYIQARSIYKTPSPHLAGTWIGKYSADGKCLVQPWQISDITSRPALVVCDGHLYSAYNVKPNLIVDGKKIYRSHLRLSELNANTQPIRSWDITSPISIQYPCLNSFDKQVYITFVEDRENSNPKDQKGSIAFTRTRL